MTNAKGKVSVDQEKVVSPWDTESGLVDDIDGWMTNCRFGKKEEYQAKVALSEGAVDESSGLLFLTDLVDETGTLIANQGWSIGSGWTVNEDGSEISHPKRNNVVKSTLYGQLQDKVRGDLKVDMEAFGVPTVASSWSGMGFHFNQVSHATMVKGVNKDGLMPTAFLGVNEAIRNGGSEEETEAAPTTPIVPLKAPVKTPAKPVATAKPVTALEQSLIDLARAKTDAGSFALAASKIKGVSANDALMKSILDDSDSGFYALHHGG